MVQEVFESMKEAVSAALGEAQYKSNNMTQHKANSPTTAVIGSKISCVTTCTSGECLAEVQSDLNEILHLNCLILSSGTKDKYGYS